MNLSDLEARTRMLPEPMDNAGFEQETRGTELRNVRDVMITVDRSRLKPDGGKHQNGKSGTVGAGGGAATTSGEGGCNPDACIAARRKYLQPGPNSLAPSPWHKRKTYYLIAVIIMLLLWIIVYSILSKYNIL